MLDIHYDLNNKIHEFDRWQERWVPDILDRLGLIEKKIHEQIFGHL